MEPGPDGHPRPYPGTVDLAARRSCGVDSHTGARLPILPMGTTALMNTPGDPPSPALRSVSADEAEAAAPPVVEPEPPSDAGEPMGAKDAARPAMLGKRFRLTVASGMVAGLIVALLGHVLLAHTWNGSNASGWSWLLAVIGGLAVGAALTLFSYGVSTDRTDTGPNKPHGQADVTTQGEWSRTQERRRRRIRRRRWPRA